MTVPSPAPADLTEGTTADAAATAEALRLMLLDAFAAGLDAGSDPLRRSLHNPYTRKGSLGRNPARLAAQLARNATRIAAGKKPR